MSRRIRIDYIRRNSRLCGRGASLEISLYVEPEVQKYSRNLNLLLAVLTISAAYEPQHSYLRSLVIRNSQLEMPLDSWRT